MDHPHYHHHHGRRDDEDYPPPPPFHGGNEFPPPYPPPPQVHHSPHAGPRPDFYPPPPPPHSFSDYNAPPPPRPHSYSDYDAPPPPRPHSYSDYTAPPPPRPHSYSNYTEPPPPVVDHNPHRPHMPNSPSVVYNHAHHSVDESADKPTVKMYCKAETNYSLAIRDGKVVVARSDPSDPFQHWIKDEKFSTRVKDEEGFPSFALVNKATGQAMKHSIGATHPVQLVPYNPNVLDESVLWTESRDTGEGYRAIRMVNNIRLNVDVFNGDKRHGGVRDGSKIVLWEWKKGDNQRWKIAPH